jgi:hypothetical protein
VEFTRLLDQLTSLSGGSYAPLALWGWRVVLLDYVVISSNLVLWLGFMVFFWRTAPRRSLQERYPFKVRMLWLLPFSSRWRHALVSEDVEKIRKFRKVFLVFFVASVVNALLKFTYYKFFFVRLHALR